MTNGKTNGSEHLESTCSPLKSDEEESLKTKIDQLKINECLEQQQLQYAKELKAKGQYEEAIKILKSLIAIKPTKEPCKWHEEAQMEIRELIEKASTDVEKYSPKKMLQSLRDIKSVGDIKPQHFEYCSLLIKHSSKTDVVDVMIKSGAIYSYLIQVIGFLKESDLSNDQVNFLGAFMHFINNLILNSTFSLMKLETKDFEAETFNTVFLDCVSTLISNRQEILLASLVQVICTYYQRIYPSSDSSANGNIDIPDYAKNLIGNLIKYLLPTDSPRLSDIAISLVLKFWSRSNVVKPWISDFDNLNLLFTKFFALQTSGKLQDGHLTVILKYLCDSDTHTNEKLQNTLMKLFQSYFDSARLNSLKFLAALFTANSEMAAKIFGQDAVLADIIDCADFESNEIQIAIMDLLSTACVRKSSRNDIRMFCLEYLNATSSNSSINLELKSKAALVLSKLAASDIGVVSPTSAGSESSKTSPVDQKNMAREFLKTILNKCASISDIQSAVEGLSYLSSRPIVKELLQGEASKFFPRCLLIIKDIKSKENGALLSSLAYGVSLICDNLALFKRKKTQEEQQIQKLREFAKEALPEEDDPRDLDESVLKRIKSLVDGGILKVLVELSLNSSHRIVLHVSRTWANLARDPSLRGLLVQSGAVKSLLRIFKSFPVKDKPTHDENQEDPALYAASAIARIAISLDPHIAFPSTAVNLVKPLITALTSENQLYQFESLLALTNLAGMDESRVGEIAITIRKKLSDKSAFRLLEDRILSEHPKIQCAAVELLCNLMSDSECASNWLCIRGETRVKILLALCNAEEVACRKAASASLAMLSYNETAQTHLRELKNTVKVVVNLVADDDMEIIWRGLFLINGLCSGKDLNGATAFVKKATPEELNLLASSLVRAASSSHPQVAPMAQDLITTLTKSGLLVAKQ